MLALSPARPVINHRILTLIAAHPSFSNVTLVHTDPVTRQLTHGPSAPGDPRRRTLAFINNPTVRQPIPTDPIRSYRIPMAPPALDEPSDPIFHCQCPPCFRTASYPLPIPLQVLQNGADFLVRVSTFSYCALPDGMPSSRHSRMVAFNPKAGKGLFLQQNGTLRDTIAPDRWVVWLEHHRVRAVVRYAEDPRPVWLRGRQHMVFTRKNGHGYAKQYLAALEPEYREVFLNYPVPGYTDPLNSGDYYNRGGGIHIKNWVPWVHDGVLHVSHSLCPHEVLRCNDLNGRCEFAYSTRLKGCDPLLRGGSQAIQVAGWLLCVAHTTKMLTPVGMVQANRTAVDREYQHRFLLLEPAPPFAMRALSAPFSFPPAFGNEVDLIQFCSGIGLTEGNTSLTITYGVGDCIAMKLTLPTEQVLSQLVGNGTATSAEACGKRWCIAGQCHRGKVGSGSQSQLSPGRERCMADRV